MTKNKRIIKKSMEDSSVSSASTMSISNSSSASSTSEILPGPSGLPLVGSMLEWEGPQTNIYWTKKYGAIYQVKMGPKTLIYLNSIDLVEKYLEGRTGEKFLDRPMGPAVIGEGLLFGSGEPWRKNKKAFMKALHTSSFMEHMEGSIKSELQIVLEALSSQTKKTTKIGDVLLPACANAIAGLLLGGTLPPDSHDRKQMHKVSRDLEGVDLNSIRTKIALKFPSLREPMSKLFFKEIVDFHGVSRRLQRLLRQWIRQCRAGTLTPTRVPYTDNSRTNDTAPRKPPRLRIPADALLETDNTQQQQTIDTTQQLQTIDNTQQQTIDNNPICRVTTTDSDTDSESMNKSSESLGLSSSEESLLTSHKDANAIDRAIRCSSYYSAFGFSDTSKGELGYERCEPVKFVTPVTPLTEFQWRFSSRMSINVQQDSVLKRIIDQPEFLDVTEENDHDMIQALMDMFFGGIAPVLSSLEFILLHLTRNPAMQELAQRELDSKADAQGEISWAQHKDCHYVRACITEGLRIGSVTPSTIPHIATEDTEIEGFHVPKETLVLGSLISLHNDPRHYIDPEAFRPQRHLDTKRQFQTPESYRPYGVGARRCLGEKMAEMTLFLFIAQILRHFTLRPPTGKKSVNTDSHMRITRRLKDFRCVLEPRNVS